jgi:NADH-quinone oxidoreductase subunit L
MWFLEHSWLIPVVPAVGFFLIILFGKKMPMKGSELGIASMLTSVVMAGGTAYQWIQRVDEGVGSESTTARLVGALGRSIVPRAEAAAEGKAYIEPFIKQWNWWQSGGTKFTIGMHIDGLSVMLLLVVAFISTLVQIYSLEYLRGDRRYTHFFAALTLFSAGMLTMVLAEGLVQFLLGWEIMGLCSFMLIGHWWEDGANSRAALKAFFTVRTGDVGLLIGIAILFFSAKTFSIQGISEWAGSGQSSHLVLLMASVALLVAIIGKSGQFPLHTWLPDAMAGPTPVSSLLHSSTMVVAGIFLGARLYPVFWEGFSIGHSSMNPMALIGGITIVIAALLAFVQVDIKKVLAYSTVSQLGYMLMGLGVGAWTPAVFHIFTHAFFKACLFLGAGSVAHSGSHHSFDMKKDMGGLRKKMPITFATFVISTAALAGVPLLAGFFSKDEIIASAGHNGYKLFMYIGLAGAFMTTAYMTRCVYLTFFGEARGAAAGEHHDEHDAHAVVDAHDAAHATDADDHGFAPVLAHASVGHSVDAAVDAHGHAASHGDDHGAAHGPHESPLLITVPLMILSVGAIFAGYLNAAPFHLEKFTEWVEPGAGKFFPELHAPEAFEWVKALPSIVLVILGFVASLFVCRAIYSQKKAPFYGLTQRVAPLRAGYTFLWNKYYLDDLYEKIIVRGLVGPIAGAAYWVHMNIIDGFVDLLGRFFAAFGRWTYRYVDQGVIDTIANGAGKTASGAGGGLRFIQNGKIQQYAAILFGAAALGALALVIFVQA